MGDEEVKVATGDEQVDEPKKSGLVKMLIVVVIGMVIGAGALAIPLVVLAGDGEEPVKVVQPAFLNFGEAVTSLGVQHANRYIGVNVTLQVDEEESVEIQAKIDKRKAVLMNWLLAHLSDKSIEDVSGAAGQNRLRREIQDQFNDLLFDDDMDRIRDVLFEEFKIQ